jgi:hypothetical protein
MMSNARALSRGIDSGQITLDQGAAAYQALAAKSFFALPLYSARNSLRDRYVAEADQVLADYREASESTPVYFQDWQRAGDALKAAFAITEDKSVLGKLRLVSGYLSLWRRDHKKRLIPDYRAARADFEAAQSLLPHSPDPHLGLATIYMHDGELEKAQRELDESKNHGFTPGRRELSALADTYKRRGEKWMSFGQHAHDIAKMKDALQHAENDLDRAQELYNQIAPFYQGAENAEKVSMERGEAAKYLAEAQAVNDPPKETP